MAIRYHAYSLKKFMFLKKTVEGSMNFSVSGHNDLLCMRPTWRWKKQCDTAIYSPLQHVVHPSSVGAQPQAYLLRTYTHAHSCMHTRIDQCFHALMCTIHLPVMGILSKFSQNDIPTALLIMSQIQLAIFAKY